MLFRDAPITFYYSASTNIIIVKGWLDDIGLPQYKSQFDEGRVDGRMLHYMTVVGVKYIYVCVCLESFFK